MKKVIEITVCKHWCPFYGTTMDGMVCNHPYFDDKEAFEDMIINHRERIPSKCPLRKEPLDIHYKIKI